MHAIVEYNYTAQESDELTIRKGDIIKDVKVMVGGWWEGSLGNKRGMFPDNFVKLIETSSSPVSSGEASESSSASKNEVVQLRNGSGRRYCKVLFSYEPCNEDELRLTPQEAVEYMGEVEEGWWRGRLKGKVGVFPSNFVSNPNYEEEREYCRVLFPYDAANEDELTLAEGDVITVISRDAADKGWWRGELKGQIGLFPDNFVELLKSEHQEPSQRHESTTGSLKSMGKHTGSKKNTEKTNNRRSLDVRSMSTDSKKLGSSPSGTSEKKSHALISSLKRFVSADGSNNNDDSLAAGVEEELDGVERGEPLSHLTASRAKAPRRRPPTQHMRHQPPGSNSESVINGNVEAPVEYQREHEGDPVTKARKKAPWVEELKLNQLERKKISSVDRVDKAEIKKEKVFPPKPTTPTTEEKLESVVDSITKLHVNKKEKDVVVAPLALDSPGSHAESSTPASPPIISAGAPPYVPYHLYKQLLDRVALLEEKHNKLQETVTNLTDQLVRLKGSPSPNRA